MSEQVKQYDVEMNIVVTRTVYTSVWAMNQDEAERLALKETHEEPSECQIVDENFSWPAINHCVASAVIDDESPTTCAELYGTDAFVDRWLTGAENNLLIFIDGSTLTVGKAAA